MRNALSALIALVCLSGCASTQMSARSYLDADRASRVIIWNSDYSAGIGNTRGQCAQGALTMTANSLGAALDIVGKAKAGVDYSEAVTALNVSNVQTSYANLGYFYLCQLALNDLSNNKVLTATDLKEMFLDVGETAEKLGENTGQTSAVISPKQTSALQALFEKKALAGEKPPTATEVQAALSEAE